MSSQRDEVVAREKEQSAQLAVAAEEARRLHAELAARDARLQAMGALLEQSRGAGEAAGSQLQDASQERWELQLQARLRQEQARARPATPSNDGDAGEGAGGAARGASWGAGRRGARGVGRR